MFIGSPALLAAINNSSGESSIKQSLISFSSISLLSQGYLNRNVSIKNCRVDCNINGESYIGGIAGYTGYGGVIENCEYKGKISGAEKVEDFKDKYGITQSFVVFNKLHLPRTNKDVKGVGLSYEVKEGKW